MGLDVASGLRHAMRRSCFSRAAFVDGEPLALFGAILLCAGRAQTWCLTTGAVDRHPKAFLRASRYAVEQMAAAFPAGLVQCVDARYTAALRWLRHLGWTLEKQAHGCGAMGKPFIRATYRQGG